MATEEERYIFATSSPTERIPTTRYTVSKKVSRSLLSTITDRAYRTFPTDLLAGCDGDRNQMPHQDWKENYSLWEQHWLKTADGIVRDFRAEGLVETVKAVEDIVEWQKKYMGLGS